MARAATDILIEGLEIAFKNATSKYPNVFKVAALGYGQGGLPAVTAYVNPDALKQKPDNDIVARRQLTLQARSFSSSGTKAILNFGGGLMEAPYSPFTGGNPFSPVGKALEQIECFSEATRKSINYGARGIMIDEIDIEALTANLEAIPEKLQAQCDAIFKAWHDGIQTHITTENTPEGP